MSKQEVGVTLTDRIASALNSKKIETDMTALNVPFMYLPHGEGLPAPFQATAGAAGLDLCAAVPEDQPMVIEPGTHDIVPTGFALGLPEGYEAQIRPRSGLAAKFAVTTLNAPGTIDADYRGEVRVILINHGKNLSP